MDPLERLGLLLDQYPLLAAPVCVGLVWIAEVVLGWGPLQYL